MSQRPSGRARILIVDDERMNRDLLEVMLAPDGFYLATAASGDEALAMVAKQPPDLILLDIMMPGMDGCALVRALKSNPATKHIPTIMISALDDRDRRMLALSAGAEEYLTKPVDRAELSLRVRNLVRLKTNADYHDRYGQMLETAVGARTTALAESEQRFRQLAETIEQVFFLTNPTVTEIFYISPAYETMWGRTCKELYADPMSFTDAIHRDDRARVFAEMIPAGVMVPFDIEFRVVRPDGSERLVRDRGYPICNDAGEVYRFAGVVDDVTERRMLEGQLRQAGKMDAIGRLASGIAHDFNNLLSVILSYSVFLSEGMTSTDPARADADAIHQAGKRAVELTRQLLAFGRQQVLLPTVEDLSSIVQGLDKMLRRLIGEDVELTTVCPPSLSRILVDHGQMEQVIMNLVVNARDAMPQGGKLTIETSEVVFSDDHRAHHDGVQPGLQVMLSVSDTGVGMDRATQARVFEPFFTTKEVGKGTGLGLATVFGIVKQSGGTISVYSEPGVGSTFKMYFPAVRGRSGVTRVEPQRTARATLRGFETVLVLDDDADVRQLACAILRKYGYNALEAASSGDALLLCEQHEARIHLLLTDVVMPRMSGRQLAERLAKLRPEMKVLFMSGYTDDAVVRHGILDSTIAFIQKPLTPEALAAKVRDTLGSAEPGRRA